MTQESLATRLKDFFENHELAKKAARSIKDGREIQLNVDQNTFTFTKTGGHNSLNESSPKEPDFVFDIPSATADQLTSGSFKSVGEVGIFLFQKILSDNPAEKVRVRVKTGIITLVLSGYLGVLSEGGAEVAKFLAQRGLSNPSKIKDALAKLRG